MTFWYLLFALVVIGFVVYYFGQKKGCFCLSKKEKKSREEGPTDVSSPPSEAPTL